MNNLWHFVLWGNAWRRYNNSKLFWCSIYTTCVGVYCSQTSHFKWITNFTTIYDIVRINTIYNTNVTSYYLPIYLHPYSVFFCGWILIRLFFCRLSFDHYGQFCGHLSENCKECFHFPFHFYFDSIMESWN